MRKLVIEAPEARIWVTGDWHVGSKFHHGKLLSAHHSLAVSEGYYLIHVGDGPELVTVFSPIARRGAIWEQISPQEQIEKIHDLLAPLRGFYLPGNHERRLYMASGIDLFSVLTKNLQVEVMEVPDTVEITVGKQKYTVLMHHGEGPAENIWGLHDRLQRDWEQVDVIVAGHLHRSGIDRTIKQTPRGPREIIRVRVGHYLELPRYVREKPVRPIGACGSWLMTLRADRKEIGFHWLGSI